MATYDLIRELPLVVESYDLEGREVQPSPDFTRLTTTIHLRGGGEEGLGEDVVYDALDHIALRDAGPVLDLAGEHTVGSFSDLIGELDTFPAPPVREVSRRYRRWAFESAALDLALRQAGRSLADVLGREPRPVTFVNSLRLGEPPTLEPVTSRLERYPTLRFKLDPTSSWTEELIAELVATGAVDSLDLKGAYKDTPVDQPPDPVMYRRVAEAFPEAWLEDPALDDPDCDEVLKPHRDRITWDAPIHSVADIDALPFPPRAVNLKPSRIGSLAELMEAYDVCDERGYTPYGGGQWELGVGRGHIQYLASLFHPDAPNDTAPAGYNGPTATEGLPSSPLEPRIPETGFRWE